MNQSSETSETRDARVIQKLQDARNALQSLQTQLSNARLHCMERVDTHASLDRISGFLDEAISLFASNGNTIPQSPRRHGITHIIDSSG